MSHNVYQVLNITGDQSPELMALAGLNASGPASSNNGGHDVQVGNKWLIQSSTEDGLNVHYQLWMVYPRGREFQVTLPWRAQEACPNCQGQGVVYKWNSDNSAYEAVQCGDCLGAGANSYDSEIAITINDGIGGQRTIRKKQAGRLNARLGLRGDLILNITWVEKLPSIA
jgi:DnaJ-class molecular chaperone with C-terminal Zn finger domain